MKMYLSPTIPVILLLLLFCSCRSSLKIMQPAISNGGRAVAVCRHPSSNNELIVASETGGIFKTVNGGTDWAQITGSSTFGFSGVLYDPVNPATIIATAYGDTRKITGGGIWRSTNGGSSWTQISLPAPPAGCSGDFSVNCIDAEPGSDRIWVGASCGVLYSDDHGASWSYLSGSAGYSNERVVAFLSPVAHHLKMLTDGGVKVSNDDGINWTTSSTGLPWYVSKDVHNQLACSPLNDNHLFLTFYLVGSDDNWHRGLYMSSDNGGTWTNLIDNGGINRPTFVKTAYSLSGNNNQIDVYYSDGGCTFERATFNEGTTPSMAGGWNALALDHCDGSDLAFQLDGKTPLLFTSDGGVSTTSDQGAHWALTGAGIHGYNALQVTECTGQKHPSDAKSDLYFATQDNNIWASPDEGATWPDSRCCEGFFLNIWRTPLSPGQAKFTGVACGACGNFISDPLLAGQTGFPDPPNNNGNPFLVIPATYIQNTQISGLSDNIFDLSSNTGAVWTPRYGFTEEVRDLSKICPNSGDPVIYTAARMPGATADGQEMVGIKKITGLLDIGAPIVSTITGFGSMGIFPTMFAWYKPFGVDPFNQNHLIVPDIIDSAIKVSWDGGTSWKIDTPLTTLITGSGTLRFRWGPFTQLSVIGFDPDVPGHVLVGTVEAGVFSSCNNGTTWAKIQHSELLPNVSSFYFDGHNTVIISTYGRGLWKYPYRSCPSIPRATVPILQLAEPLIFWKGGYVPISQIHNPDVCPVCGFFIVQQGEVEGYTINKQTNEVTELSISSGNVTGYSANGSKLNLPFKTSLSKNNNRLETNTNSINDPVLMEFLRKNKYQIKGIYLEGNLFKGFLLYNKDIQPDSLPQPYQPKPKVYVDWKSYQTTTSGVSFIKVYATGLDQQRPITFKIDGKTVKQDSLLKFDEKGNLAQVLKIPLAPGGHTLLIEQQKDKSTIREAYTFVIPVVEQKEEDKH
jgi:hypothetical protein